MAGFRLEREAEYRQCGDRPFAQPNGVSVFASGSIAVADGGNDRICVLDETGRSLAWVGGAGFARDRFKEPVGVFVSPGQRLFVADWHNHRVVVFDETLAYLGEFGRYGKREPSGGAVWGPLRKALGTLDTLASTGTYVERFFGPDHESKPLRRRRRASLLFRGLGYWMERAGSPWEGVRQLFAFEETLAKPNGVAFPPDGSIVVSQKDGRCLSIYEDRDGRYFHRRDVLGPTPDTRFGRLGNVVAEDDGSLLVCDERSHCIWRLSATMELQRKIDTGEDSGTGEFLPFSCAPLGRGLLAVCGGTNFQVLAPDPGRVVYRSRRLGELHGVAFDRSRRRLFVADRSGGLIRVYSVARLQ